MTDGDRDVVTQIITMTFKPENEQDFLEFAKDVIEQVRANEPDTLTYVLTKHLSEPHTYAVTVQADVRAAVSALDSNT